MSDCTSLSCQWKMGAICMSDGDINKMTFSRLREEVQSLRDELAIMKRKYEDILYNLDDTNFGYKFVKEKNDIKTEIAITAEGIKTKVSKEELKKYSTTAQTAEMIKTTVSASYVTDLMGDTYVTNSVFEQRADEIMLSLDKVSDKYDSLSSKFEQQAGSISSIVSKNISAYFESDVMPTKRATDEQKSMLCLYNDTYWYYSDFDEVWKTYPAEGLKTMFKQTSEGFSLTGDIVIDGSVSASISKVSDTLHLGESEFEGGKSIVFSNMARISSCDDGIGSYGGLKVSAVKIYLGSKLDLSGCQIIEWGDNAPVAVFG